MKYSNTALKELSARYAQILRKCAYLNAAILITASLATPATAAVVTIPNSPIENQVNSDSSNQNAAGLTISYGDTLEQSGVNNIIFNNNSSVNSGGAMKALNGFTAGDGWEFNNNHSDKISGGLYVKIPNDGGENRNVIFGKNTKFIGNDSKWLGGALGIEAADTVTLGDDAEFKNNSTLKDGGAIAVWTDGTNTSVTTGTTLNLGKTLFEENTAANRGGALANLNNDTTKTAWSNTVKIGAGSEFKTNKAQFGGAVYNTGTMNIDGAEFNANESLVTDDWGGGAFVNTAGATMNITNSKFYQNKATNGYAGAGYTSASLYYTANPNPNTLTITNSTFIENSAAEVGALGLFSNATLDNVDFTKNQATSTVATSDGAGAIFLGAESKTVIKNGSDFTSNISAVHGGAISMRGPTVADNSEADLDILGSTFTDNQAGTHGGAIYATFYSSKAIPDAIYISDSTFIENKALGGNGGAIFNLGQKDKKGNLAQMTINNGTFTGNTATDKGGAIYNEADATINLTGTNKFSGNMAGSDKNDIYNDGVLNVAGILELDGGITGNGTVKFETGSSLKGALNLSTALVTASTITGETTFTFDTNSTGGTVTFTGDISGFKFSDNALFDVSETGGVFTFAKKSDEAAAESIATATGASAADAAAAVAVTSGSSSNESFNALSDGINEMIQSSDAAVVAAGVQAAAALAPAEAPVQQAQATQAATMALSAASSRLSGGVSVDGESSGDFNLGKGAVWAKALYNKSKFTGNDGFDARSRGLALGAESQLTDAVKVGVGYAYSNSDIKPDLNKTEIDSNTAMVYAEYKPNNWYVNGVAAYTWGRYDETKYSLSSVGSKYNVYTTSLQAMTGYDIHAKALTLTPEAGLRYMNINQKSHTDSIGSKVAGNKSDIFTGVLGAKAVVDWAVSDTVVLKPEVRAAVTYDFVRDKASTVMTLANGSVLATEGSALKRLGGEFAAGFTSEIADNLELGIFWEGKFRKDYTDNTGMIHVKYNF